MGAIDAQHEHICRRDTVWNPYADGRKMKARFWSETSNKTSVRFAGRGNRLRNYVDARKLIAGCACQLGSYQGSE